MSKAATFALNIIPAGEPPPPFSRLTFGAFGRYGDGQCPGNKCISSDSWVNTWADDDKIYLAHDDVLVNGGWNGSTGNANVMFSTLSDFSSTMTGTMINPMTAFGTLTQAGSDGANYKLTTLASIRGTLIMGVVRQAFNTRPASQTNWLNTQFIKSADHGVTWTPLPPSVADPYASPMFAHPRFAMPSLLQNGQDYRAVPVDRMEEFVYGISADQSPGHYDSASWAGGGSDQIFLGRVEIAKIANLSAGDWTYYQGGDGNLDANWGNIASAVPVLATPGQFINGYFAQAVFIPAFGQYLLIESYPKAGNPIDFASLTWNIFRGLHPWGPWSLIQQNRWDISNPQGPNSAYAFYFPTVAIKSLGVDGGRSLSILTTGDFLVNGMYTLYVVPVTLS